MYSDDGPLSKVDNKILYIERIYKKRLLYFLVAGLLVLLVTALLIILRATPLFVLIPVGLATIPCFIIALEYFSRIRYEIVHSVEYNRKELIIRTLKKQYRLFSGEKYCYRVRIYPTTVFEPTCRIEIFGAINVSILPININDKEKILYALNDMSVKKLSENDQGTPYPAKRKIAWEIIIALFIGIGLVLSYLASSAIGDQMGRDILSFVLLCVFFIAAGLIYILLRNRFTKRNVNKDDKLKRC